MITFDINYGSLYKSIDITQVVYEKCKIDNFLYIPAGDVNRASIFGDPLPGILKTIFIIEKVNEIVNDIHVIKDTELFIINLYN